MWIEEQIDSQIRFRQLDIINDRKNQTRHFNMSVVDFDKVIIENE